VKKGSLRFKMAVGGIILVLIPIAVIGIFAALKSSNAIKEISEQQSIQIAKSLSGMVQLVLQEEMNLVVAVAVDKSVVDAADKAKQGGGDAETAAASAYLSQIMKKAGGNYEGLTLLNANGVVFADGQGGADKGINASEREAFKIAKAGKVGIGSPVKSKRTGNIIMQICAPISNAQGEFTGAVLNLIKIGFMTDQINSVKLGETGYAFMVDKTGMTIAHPNKDRILSDNITTHAELKNLSSAMTSQKTGTETYDDQGKKHVGFAPVELTGWSVGVFQTETELMAAARSIAYFIGIMGIIFLAVAVAAVMLYSTRLTHPIHRAVAGMKEGAGQVASAASQIASASQSLAEGASEQASSLEETSSSLEEMSSMTRQNADNANQAKVMMAETKQIVEKVDTHMNRMAGAIAEITRTSEETGKIIKTIDEIAFQTNLLALNAAVEAARAGEAGAGFAVVADEVRNLALRAAEAAKNTNGLIENTIKAVKQGSELTRATQEAFRENVTTSGKVAQLIDEITSASEEQAQGIEQINKAVSEMDKVTQQTAASAEESASAAEELTAQAEQMKGYVSDLAAVVSGSGSENPGEGENYRSSAVSGRESHRPQTATRKLLLAGANRSAGKSSAQKGSRPGQVIPLEEDFKDFKRHLYR
jgi:methyl-accepting chemotaxis protein